MKKIIDIITKIDFYQLGMDPEPDTEKIKD